MWTKEKLDDILSKPSDRLIEDIKKIDGDIMLLGAGGKMGPTMALLAQRAINKAKIAKKVYAVSRFSSQEAKKQTRTRRHNLYKCRPTECRKNKRPTKC